MKNLPSPPLTIFYVFFRARDPKARVYFHICRRIFARAARVCLRRTGIYDICFYCCWHGVVVYLKFKRSVERIAVHKSIIFNPRRWWWVQYWTAHGNCAREKNYSILIYIQKTITFHPRARARHARILLNIYKAARRGSGGVTPTKAYPRVIRFWTRACCLFNYENAKDIKWPKVLFLVE